MNLNCYFFADEAHIKREKQKTKEAKKSRWWQQKKDSKTCHYCNKTFLPEELTMDHVVPIARGGKTTPGNIVPACKECNKAKGVNTPIDMFFETTNN